MNVAGSGPDETNAESAARRGTQLPPAPAGRRVVVAVVAAAVLVVAGSVAALQGVRPAAAAAPTPTPTVLRIHERPDPRIAAREATALLAAAIVPPGSVRLATTSILALRGSGGGSCTHEVLRHRLVRVPHSTMAQVERYLAAHPTAPLSVAGHGSGGDRTAVTDLSVVEMLQPTHVTGGPTLAYVIARSGSATVIRIDVTVVPTTAECAHSEPMRRITRSIPLSSSAVPGTSR